MKLFIRFFNKKAEISARKMIFYIVSIPVIVIAFLLLVSILPTIKSEIAKIPPGLEDHLLVQRFLNSPLCFAFLDKETNKVYPRTIDLTKFNEDNLNRCYDAEETNVKAYRLTLVYNNEKITINTRNWEGFLKKSETEYVFVFDEGETQGAKLLIEMQDAK